MKRCKLRTLQARCPSTRDRCLVGINPAKAVWTGSENRSVLLLAGLSGSSEKRRYRRKGGLPGGCGEVLGETCPYGEDDGPAAA